MTVSLATLTRAFGEATCARASRVLDVDLVPFSLVWSRSFWERPEFAACDEKDFSTPYLRSDFTFQRCA
jgi:hypothetical protein|eukprot:30957-Pelagococcus_subviridis.AAC.53